MSNHRVYISASTQSENIGVGAYGTEQSRMMYLADRIKYWLGTQSGKYTVFRNSPGWTLQQTVNDCNALNCELFIDNHSNADSSPRTGGSEAFYYHQGGTTSNSYRLAKEIYKRIAPLSPGADRGVLPDNAYVSSLYVIQQTTPPAALIEHFFHSNPVEVNDYLTHIDGYAKETAKGVAAFCGELWTETVAQIQTIEMLVDEMIKDGIVSNRDHWIGVLKGTITPVPAYLQVAFSQATKKIGW